MLTYPIDRSCQLPHATLAATYDKYFPDKTDGCYVEVGAFDGITFGVTSALAHLGWRGLCIEAHPEYAEMGRLKLINRNVKFEACAAGDFEGEITLYVYLACSSTKCNEITRENGVKEDYSIQVPIFKLDTILARNAIPQDFEVLSIDVEDAELEVLAGFDIDHWRPKMIIIESTEKHPNPLNHPKAKKIGEIFAAAGYENIYSDLINTIYVRK